VVGATSSEGLLALIISRYWPGRDSDMGGCRLH